MIKTPVAWLNLMHDPRRLATSLAGVGFAVVLIFTELGFLNALLDSSVEPIRRLQADGHQRLLMVHRDKETLVDAYRFPGRWLVAAEACGDVVERADPIFFEMSLSSWHNPVTDRSRTIRVISSTSDDLLGMISGTAGAIPSLRRPGTVLFDRNSKAGFGYKFLPVEVTDRRQGAEAEVKAVLSRSPITLVGEFELGTDFVNDGNLIVGTRTFDDLFPSRQVLEPDVATVDLGVIRLVDGIDPEVARARLVEFLEADGVNLNIMTTTRMIAREQKFWLNQTPVGWIFALGVVLGFVVGVVICFQVLSSDIRDHLAEYATLKAIGYGNSYLVKVVFRQATWLAILGFLPSVACAHGLYWLLRKAVGLPMQLKADTLLYVFGLTILMCLSSAYMAIRKLFKADPAELFR